MAKPHVTRTLGPIHFEDLDPHRFEDLIRQLAYDFRPWQSIESTGRGGADDGFDVRAYEELRAATRPTEDDPEPEDVPHPMEGNVWMIQCKREKEVGPKKVASIISDAVDPANPPYGYILAAPVHFSKAAHDKFREELRGRGVMEFYLWGAGELEDMLYQPKNDHVLFAFFGISLTTRRRSRASEIRSVVSVKNKLLRVLGEDPRHKSVLVRDLNDDKYPYDEDCRDFDKRPPWKTYSVSSLHPLGLVVSVGKYFAYLDRRRKEWDFTRTGNLASTLDGRHTRRQTDRDEDRISVKGFWEQLPRENRVTFIRNGLIRYDAIEYVDDKGDCEYDVPHIFVPFDAERGPFVGFLEYLQINEHQHEGLSGLVRKEVFPSSFPVPTFGTIHEDKVIQLDAATRSSLRYGAGDITLYDVAKQYGYLKPTDVVSIDGADERKGDRKLLKVTSVASAKGEDLLKACEEDPALKAAIERQIGRELRKNDSVDVIEAVSIYDWQIEQNRPVL